MSFALLLPPVLGYLLWDRVVVREGRDRLEALGMALPLGAGVTVLLSLILAPIGFGAGAVSAVLALAGVACLLLRPAPGPGPGAGRVPRWLAAACLSAVLAQLALVAAGVAREGRLTDWDAWAIWGMKARAFYLDGGADAYLARGEELAFSWPSRPPLTALFQAFVYAGLGRPSEPAARGFHVLLYVSVLLLLFSALRRRHAPAAAAVGVALFATLPNLAYHASSGVANLALGAYLLALLLALERAAEQGRGPALLAVGLLAGFAALTRDEGRWLAAIAVAVRLAVGAAQGLSLARLAKAGAATAAIAAAVYAPWAVAVARSGAPGLLETWSPAQTLGRVGAHLTDAPAVLRMIGAELLLPVEQTRASPFESALGLALLWPSFAIALILLPCAPRRDPLAWAAGLSALGGIALYAAGLWLFPYADLADLQHHWLYVLDRHLVSLAPAAAYAVVAALAPARQATSARAAAASPPASVRREPTATERGA